MQKRFKFSLLLALLSFSATGAQKAISELDPIVNADVDVLDVLPIVDTSAGQTKKIAVGEMDLRYVKKSGDSMSGALNGATSAVFPYLNGLTANIQTQINSLIGGGSSCPLATKSSNYTMTSADCNIICNTSGGTINITLPTAASGVNKPFQIKNFGPNVCNILTQGGNQIDGQSSISLDGTVESRSVASDGSNWFII